MPDDLGEELGYVAALEARQLDDFGVRQPCDLREEGTHGMMPRQLVGAERADDEQGNVGRGTNHVGEEIPGRCIGPVQVLDHEDHRPVGSERLEEAEESVMQAPGRVVVRRRRVGPGELGNEHREIAPLHRSTSGCHPERWSDRRQSAIGR